MIVTVGESPADNAVTDEVLYSLLQLASHVYSRITDRVIRRIGQMNIDDDGSSQKASHGGKSNKRSAATKEGGRAVSCPLFPLFAGTTSYRTQASRPPKEPKGKRARVDSNPQFHEDSFLTAGKYSPI